jgi:hypothetical protein
VIVSRDLRALIVPIVNYYLHMFHHVQDAKNAQDSQPTINSIVLGQILFRTIFKGKPKKEMNTQRRIFRGRGGPTDGRLPKHNARRRKSTKNDDDGGTDKKAEPKYSGPAPQPSGRPTSLNVAGEVAGGGSHSHETCEGDAQEEGREDRVAPSGGRSPTTGAVETTPRTTLTPITTPNDVPADDERTKRCLQEIKHLEKRIRNVQDGIQLSKATSSPATYQENVLHPVRNCVNEWRSIARHYGATTKELDDGDDDCATTGKECSLSDDSRKHAGLAVFQLIQLSLQTGPLRGSNPGYFKRCGSEVACTVWVYLEEVIPNAVLGECMGFSSKQMDAMNQWKSNADKAFRSNRPPSKSAARLQQT